MDINKINKHNIWFKLITLIVITSFLCQNAAAAGNYYLTKEHSIASESKLANSSMFQLKIVSSDEPKGSIYSDLEKVFQAVWQKECEGQTVKTITQEHITKVWTKVFSRLNSKGHEFTDHERKLYQRVFTAKNIKEYFQAEETPNAVSLANLVLKANALIHAFIVQKEDLQKIRTLSLDDIDEVVEQSYLEEVRESVNQIRSEPDKRVVPKTGLVLLSSIGGNMARPEQELPYSEDPHRRFASRFFIQQISYLIKSANRVDAWKNTFHRDFMVLFKKDKNDSRRNGV